MNNLSLQFFKKNFYDLINQSQLPIGVIRLLLKEVLSDIDLLYDYQLKKEEEQNQKKIIKLNKIIDWKEEKEEDSSENEKQDKLN